MQRSDGITKTAQNHPSPPLPYTQPYTHPHIPSSPTHSAGHLHLFSLPFIYVKSVNTRIFLFFFLFLSFVSTRSLFCAWSERHTPGLNRHSLLRWCGAAAAGDLVCWRTFTRWRGGPLSLTIHKVERRGKLYGKNEMGKRIKLPPRDRSKTLFPGCFRECLWRCVEARPWGEAGRQAGRQDEGRVMGG